MVVAGVVVAAATKVLPAKVVAVATATEVVAAAAELPEAEVPPVAPRRPWRLRSWRWL